MAAQVFEEHRTGRSLDSSPSLALLPESGIESEEVLPGRLTGLCRKPSLRPSLRGHQASPFCGSLPPCRLPAGGASVVFPAMGGAFPQGSLLRERPPAGEGGEAHIVPHLSTLPEAAAGGQKGGSLPSPPPSPRTTGEKAGTTERPVLTAS